MTDEMWEDGLREVMTGTAVKARVAAPPTDVILRKGRSSLRWRTGLTGAGVVSAVAAAVFAATTFAAGPAGRSESPGAVSTSTGLPQAPNAVVRVGAASAKIKVELYEDYRCPMCKAFDDSVGSTLDREVAAGRIQIDYRPTDLIDSVASGTGSVVAGNAVLCANEHGDFAAYRTAVFAHQPSETADAFGSAALLIAIARGIKGLDTPAFEKCVEDQPYAAAVKRNLLTAIDGEQCTGMPCLIADGHRWNGAPTAREDLGQVFGTWLSQIIASH
jgi:protein-disulfide isomerase